MSGWRLALLRLAVLAPLVFNLLAMPQPAEAATLVVNSATDDRMEEVCDAHHCSFAEAVRAANMNRGADAITFHLPGDPPYAIRLSETIVIISTAGPLTIDGSVPGSDRPGVVLEGGGGASTAIISYGDDVLIKGLAIVDFGTGVAASGERVVLEHNRLGASPNGDAGGNGIGVVAHGNITVRWNEFLYNDVGIEVRGAGTLVRGNTFVDDGLGVASGNGTAIVLHGTASEAQIGGYADEERNVISGSRACGISDVSQPGGNNIVGNYIGTDRSGTYAVPNEAGICIPRGYGSKIRHDSIVWNVISGNNIGVQLTGERHRVENSRIGINAAGTAALPNRIAGVTLETCHSCELRTNVISGNPVGVQLLAASTGGANTDVELSGNKIGTNPSGASAIANAIGIQVSWSQDTIIGGGEDGAGNVISGNDVGIQLFTNQAAILGNSIGTTLMGGDPLPNGIGIELAAGGEGVTIGGLVPGDANEIAFSLDQGILSGGAENFVVEGNEIHDNGAAGIRLQLDGLRPTAMGSRIRIQQNSIYDNGGLGIRVADPSLNASLEPPQLTGVTNTSATGTTCARCEVELFLAAPDPSGSGEGMTHLVGVTAGSDGTFRATFPPQDPCSELTATTLDGPGNTSEFSQNRDLGICATLLPSVALTGILIAGFAGSALVVIIRRRPPGWSSLPWAALGGLIGVGLAVVVLMTPNVQVVFPEDSGQEQEAPAGHQPPPQQVPPTVETSTPMAPVTASVTPTSTETLEPTFTPTPTLGPPQAEAVQNANCRFGPSTVYDVVGYLLRAQSAPIVGRNAQGNWWAITIPDRGRPCWVSGSTVQASGDLGSVQVLAAPPTPTRSPTPEPEGCWVWNANLQQNLCIAPCPDNAQPGGACTP